MARKPPTQKQLAALEPGRFPKPKGAPAGAKAATMNVAVYPETISQVADLRAEVEASKSEVVRAAIAFAHAHQAEFLAEAFGDGTGSAPD